MARGSAFYPPGVLPPPQFFGLAHDGRPFPSALPPPGPAPFYPPPPPSLKAAAPPAAAALPGGGAPFVLWDFRDPYLRVATGERPPLAPLQP